jgi:photosystem II stability/assembly factor-like uncharacterized protein
MSINKPKIGIHILKVNYVSVIVLFFLLFARQGWGAVYYVDNTVPDTHVASASPDFTTYDHMTFSITGGSDLVYHSVTDINSGSFSPDDQILFRRGQTWREQLIIPSSGALGHPIRFGAYGTGYAPVISGDIVPSHVSEEIGGVFASGFENETNSDHENVSDNFTGSRLVGGNTIANTTVADTVNYGVKAAKIIFAGVSGTAHVYKNIPGQTDCYVRCFFKLDPSFLMTGGSSTCAILGMYDTISGKYVFQLGLRTSSFGGDFYAAGRINTDVSGLINYSIYKADFSPSVWHTYEIHWKQDKTNGGAQIWLDGVSIYNDFKLATSSFTPDQLRVGGDAGSGWLDSAPIAGSILYIDDVKLDATGPLGNYVSNRAYSVDTNSKSHLLFSGLSFQHAATANIHINSDDITVTECDISKAGLNAQLDQNTEGDGILLETGATNTNIIKNVIYGNLRHGLYNSGEKDRANDSSINYNFIYANRGSGFISDNAQSGSVLYNNTIDTNRYGMYFGGSTGYTFKNNCLSRNGTLDLYAPVGASLTHSSNNYYRASSVEKVVTYGGANYTAANLADFEATAVASNPASNIEVTTTRHIAFSYNTGSVLWAVDYSGNILTSTDYGQTWTVRKTFENGIRPGAIFVDSRGYIYTSPGGGTEQGIWRSTDSSTFSKVLDLSGIETDLFISTFCENNSGILFAGLKHLKAGSSNFVCQIYRSTDSGVSWTQVYNNKDGEFVSELAVDPTTDYVYATIADLTSPYMTKGILRSTDAGDTWPEILTTMPQTSAIFIGEDYRLFGSDAYYLMNNNGRIWRTTDDITWTEVFRDSGPSYCDWIRRDPDSGEIYVSFVANEDVKTTARIYVSSDEGQTWTLTRILPAIKSFDGSQYASNIMNGTLFLNVVSDGLVRNGLRLKVGDLSLGPTPLKKPKIKLP